MCDLAEAGFYLRALACRGLPVLSPADLASYGFHTCVVDLEDELIRALGPARALDIVADLGLRRAFSRFSGQPFWRDQTPHAQLKRFAGTTSGRKALLARAFAAALPPDQQPRPLALLLDQIGQALQARGGPPLARFPGSGTGNPGAAAGPDQGAPN
jgi:hypothetical protein